MPPRERAKAVLGHKFTQAGLIAVAAYLIFRFGIRPPIPSSLLSLYMGITLAAILLYVLVDDESWGEFRQPPGTLLLERENKRIVALRYVVVGLVPLLVGWVAYARLNPGVQPPAELRSVHPAPPASIQFRGESLDIHGLENPLRGDAANFEANVQRGFEVYFSYCFYCHGDTLDGKGHFAQGLNPPPADFTDPGAIAQLQESYVFWRIAKGGPGLPKESAPWNSAMPAWEDTLTEEEIWQIILYLYNAAGVSPRTWK